MLRLVVVLVPSIISIGLFRRLKGDYRTPLELAFYYAVFLLSNIACMAAILYMRGHATLVIDPNMNNVVFLLKYLLLTLIYSVVAPYALHRVIHLKIRFRITRT